MNKHYKKYSKIFLFMLTILFIYLAYKVYIGLSSKINNKNGFTNYNLRSLQPGKIPQSEENPLLKGIYPLTGKKTVSDKSYNDIWWNYPIFKEGSYKQITNNLRYYANPDEGTCVGAEFCNAIYDNKKVKSNYILPLPPVSAPKNENGPNARVNYYWSHPDILLQPEPDFALQPNYS